MKEKSRKLFEKVDDNPGSYFGMLVENWDELNESLGLSNQDKNELVNAIEKARKNNRASDAGITNRIYVDFGTYGMKLSKVVGRKEHRKFVNAWRDKSTDDIIKELSSQDWEINESLKEDKFVPRDKMSKKDKKELDSQKRNTWGNTNPVTKVQPNKKAYDRKRDKKTNLDEAKKGSKVYIAIGLEKGKEPKILGVYDSKEKANEQYKDSKMWVNISEQTVK